MKQRLKSPQNTALTLDDLPPANTTRWVAARKAQVVTAVHCGLISLEDACRRYALSVEEFSTWQNLIEYHGVAGLHAHRANQHRKSRWELLGSSVHELTPS